MTDLVYDSAQALDPLGDAEQMAEAQALKNFAKVGSSRPSALLYTYGPGAILDLSNFTIMPGALDDWDRIWARRPADSIQTISAPRLLKAVQMLMDPAVSELRPFPWAAVPHALSTAGKDLGVPARVFPQWMKCTGCDRLAKLSVFAYRNTHPYRPDLAQFEHTVCHGRRGGRRKTLKNVPVVPARYLLACPDGHLDEFPYDWWVHEGQHCPKSSDVPVLIMSERAGGRGATARIRCESCGASRGMNEAQGETGRSKLPACRGRMPHLGGFQHGCTQETRLMLVGASNLWFPATQSIIVMPTLDPAERLAEQAAEVTAALGDKLPASAADPSLARARLEMLPEVARRLDLDAMSDTQLGEILAKAVEPPESDAARADRRAAWNPVELLVPEWRYLQKDPEAMLTADEKSGLTLSPRGTDGLPAPVARVLAVDRLRQVNALVGFTRIDDFDRASDPGNRLVRLARDRIRWTVATEDRGEGFFLQLDEDAVAAWELRAHNSELWAHHAAAHERNFRRRFSETAKAVDPETRLPDPRYWLVHTLSHVLLRELALSSGYGAASLSERLYAWTTAEGREPAAGVLICTTASDSDGTLGGLVALSDPTKLASIMRAALRRAGRCSSDPVCASRTPKDPEDFLHGAACHCCTFASETSCEKANRFLDRRFLLTLPGAEDLGFFGRSHDW